MIWAYVLLGLLAGGAVAVQAGVNGELRAVLGSAAQAALVSAAITTALLFLLATLVMRASWPDRSSLADAPWWVWSGGALGGAYLVAAAVLAPRLGAGVLFALIVVGQMLFSLALDHYGLAGFPRHAINPARVLGAILLIGGAILVQRA